MSKPPPSPPIFFLDECTDGASVAEVMRTAGFEIRRHRDYFGAATPDDTWIPDVAVRGWVILTLDTQQFLKPLEVRQLYLSNAREFIIRGKGLKGEERASLVISHRKRIENICRNQPAPFIAYILPSCVVVKYSAKQMKAAVKRQPGSGEV